MLKNTPAPTGSQQREQGPMVEDAICDAYLSLPAKLLPLLSEKANSVICPHGISVVLAMAAEGASEGSLAEILCALGFESMEDLREAVLAAKTEACPAFTSENSLTLMQGKDDMVLLDAFKRVMEESYRATVSEKAVDSELSSLELENVADFKAKWAYKPKRDASHFRRFYHADGTSSHPAYLSAEAELRCYQGRSPQASAVALPYRSIPYEMVLVDSEKPLTECELKSMLSMMEKSNCKVRFPEFAIENKHNLIPLMNRIGLTSIFNSYNEAFDRMATEPLYAEAFKQKAKIEVDQEGTVAQAVTTMLCTKTLCMPRIDVFDFDRPFYYFVRQTKTGEIIFMGRVNRLTDCKRIVTDESEFRPISYVEERRSGGFSEFWKRTSQMNDSEQEKDK
ncbi:MAG: serpin family protein [Selenomonadales bacterium]|nr:serpin family protein [Selenomonadales bacterium]